MSTHLAHLVTKVRNDYPNLSRAEQAELVTRYREHGCMASRERLILSVLGLIIQRCAIQAKSQRLQDVDFEELFSLACLRAIRCVDQFDASKGAWSSYIAWQCMGAASEFMRMRVRVRRHESSLSPQFDMPDERNIDARAAREEFARLPFRHLSPREKHVALGRAEGKTHRELSEELGVSKQRIQQIEIRACDILRTGKPKKKGKSRKAKEVAVA